MIAAAHELPQPVLLRDVLRVVLVLAAAASERLPPPGSVRGLVNERRPSVAEAQLAFAALQTLAGPDPLAGGGPVRTAETHSERDAALYLEEWLRARGA